MHPFHQLLRENLIQRADPERAAQMKAYMRDQFAFFGVMAGERRIALRETIATAGIPEDGVALARELFLAEERELNHCGQEMMWRCRKQWTPHNLQDLKWMVTTRSWWDTVDYIASNLTGPFLHLFPEQELVHEVRSWSDSANIWLVRTAILYQLKYKDRTDTDWLAKVILQHAHEKEFFIKKAIGWSLREYAKTDPDWVRQFVDTHALQPLSVREALKNL